MIVLSAKDLSKSYGTDIITEDVSFGVEKGDRIGIVGREIIRAFFPDGKGDRRTSGEDIRSYKAGF